MSVSRGVLPVCGCWRPWCLPLAHSSNKYLLFSFASSLPRECAPRRQSLEACCQKPPTPSQLLPTPPKEMVPAASPKSSPPQGQVSVGSRCYSLVGVVAKPPKRCVGSMAKARRKQEGWRCCRGTNSCDLQSILNRLCHWIT